MSQETCWPWSFDPPSPIIVAPAWDDWQPLDTPSPQPVYDFDFSQPPPDNSPLTPMESYLVEAFAHALAPNVQAVPTRKYCSGCDFDDLSQYRHDCMTKSQCWIDKRRVMYVLDNSGAVDPHRIACYLRENLGFHPNIGLADILDWIVSNGGLCVTPKLRPLVFELMLKRCAHPDCICFIDFSSVVDK